MEHTHHEHHHGGWSLEELSRLTHPDRVRLMPQAPVLEQINAAKGSTAADVGAGLGWLTFPLAAAVGASGTVLAIDPSHDGVAAIREKAAAEGLGQIDARVASAEDTGLGQASVDRVVWHTMYHDVANRPAALAEMHRILKPGGLWIIVDWEKRPMEGGPPQSVRFHPHEVAAEVESAGFRVLSQWSPGPVTWGLTVERP